jgi:GAF domain-containing protein
VFPKQLMAQELTDAERAVVSRARRLGLVEQGETIAYACPRLCALLSILLVPLTLGVSLILCPVLWVALHERTAGRIRALEGRLAGTTSSWA